MHQYCTLIRKYGHEACGQTKEQIAAQQKQQEPPRSALGQARKQTAAGDQLNLDHTIVIEHCVNCNNHSTHTRHDPAKYADFAARSKFADLL